MEESQTQSFTHSEIPLKIPNQKPLLFTGSLGRSKKSRAFRISLSELVGTLFMLIWIALYFQCFTFSLTFILFLLSYKQSTSSPEVRKQIETSNLRLSLPRSITLLIMSSCVSLIFSISVAKRSFQYQDLVISNLLLGLKCPSDIPSVDGVIQL